VPGFDSVSFVNQCLEGGAKTQYGAPEFWLRYFSPFNDTPFNVSQSNAVAECDAIWDCGAEHLGPICDPVSLESTSADGMGVAQTFCAALLQTAKWVDQLNPDHSRDPLSRVSSDRSSDIGGGGPLMWFPVPSDRASSRRIGRDVARRRISGREGSTSGSRARIGIAQVMSSIRR
jgi:hypothetical protein